MPNPTSPPPTSKKTSPFTPSPKSPELPPRSSSPSTQTPSSSESSTLPHRPDKEVSFSFVCAFYILFSYSLYYPNAEVHYRFAKTVSPFLLLIVIIYISLLISLTHPTLQAHIIYFHSLRLPFFKDLDIPEQFGFLRGQATPFAINCDFASVAEKGRSLYAWHVLPLNTYRKNEEKLTKEPAGFAKNYTDRLAFELLRDDPEARLVVHFHGAGGTVGSGYRVPNYLALSAGDPDKIHILTFDYQGFGRSDAATPSEQTFFNDGSAVVHWALRTAEIPPERIILFGQSMGAAVALAMSDTFLDILDVVFGGTILVAPFLDVPTLAKTYKLAGIIPILSPVANIPGLSPYLWKLIRHDWDNVDRLTRYIEHCERHNFRYQLTIIHAEDDHVIPVDHGVTFFGYAVKASIAADFVPDEHVDGALTSQNCLGAAGQTMERRTDNGMLRMNILKTGLHDSVTTYPIISLAVTQIFEAVGSPTIDGAKDASAISTSSSPAKKEKAPAAFIDVRPILYGAFPSKIGVRSSEHGDSDSVRRLLRLKRN